jgi:hypothetical protein
MILTETSDDECTIAKFKTCASQCTYCAEATDVLTHKQIFVCVRFVECTGRKVTLRGEFLGFVRANETTCEKAGAANMSGVHRGAQSRIRERIPTAQYVHCEAHVLNLAIV